jgi:hypothetical protein
MCPFPCHYHDYHHLHFLPFTLTNDWTRSFLKDQQKYVFWMSLKKIIVYSTSMICGWFGEEPLSFEKLGMTKFIWYFWELHVAHKYFCSFAGLYSFFIYSLFLLHKHEMCLSIHTVCRLLLRRQLSLWGKTDKLDGYFSKKGVTVFCSGMPFAFMRYFLMSASEQVHSTVLGISE